VSDSVLVPTDRPPDLVTFTVLVGGQALPQTVQLLEASVTFAANRVARARLSFRDGDAAEQTFALSEQGLFDPGAEIEFKVGYHREEKTIFKGVVVIQRIQAKARQPARLVVECRHKAALMTLARKTHQFAEQTDSDTISAILGDYSLAGEVTSTSASHPQMVQWNSTDWDFLLLRARANGLLVLPTLDKINVVEPDFSADAPFGLAYGTTLESFEAEIDARLQPASTKTHAWDPSQQERRESEATSSPEPAESSLDGATLADATGDQEEVSWHAGDAADDELAAWAKGNFLRTRLAKVRGTARCRGTADLTIGSVLKLEGLGDRFNGPAFVSAVQHQVMNGDWTTELQIGLDPAWFSFDQCGVVTTAQGLLPRIGGLHIGVVKQLASDPAGGERILVDLPVALPDGQGLWARLATLEAGANRGFVFRPEIGDEVIVGFFEEDPRHPVVLGSLHSGANTSPISADDANPKKGYTSKSELKLIFDEENKVITLSTPGGNKLILSDQDQGITLEDQNGNKLVMSPDTVKLESAAKLEQKSATDFKLDGGTTFAAKAATTMTLEGSSSASFKSSGSTEVKGSLVKIN